MNVLIVGAGLSGCTMARTFAEKGISVHIIEKRDHVAGNCYDEINEHGIRVSKYGAHLFHTNSERVWGFVSRFAEWVPWYHKVIGSIDGTHFPIPVNITTVNTLCGEDMKTEDDMKEWLSQNTIPNENPKNSEEVALKRVGPVLYEKIFKEYTFKQWAKYPAELDASVLERIPVRTDDQEGYFSDKYQALPKNGYTDFVRAMIDHPLITFSLETDYTEEMRAPYDFVCYTGPIDLFYADRGYPKLEYRSIVFETEHLPIDQFQPNSVVNYPSNEEPFTRIVEYKHFLNQDVPGRTTIVREYTVSGGDPYYPVPTTRNREIYDKYKVLAEEEEERGVFFVGRLANYKYYNMDAAIENALNACDRILQSPFIITKG
jgi:UDP-galactopyranose mutase